MEDSEVSKEYTNSGVEVRYPIDAIATEQARDIMDRIVPEWAEEFLRKNRKYKAVTNDLGPRGVFPDVNRKVGILKSRMWDGEPTVGEPTREVIMDLVGHLLLMVHMMDEEARHEGWTDAKVKFDLLPPDDMEDDSASLAAAQGWALDRAADRLSRPEMTVSERLELDGGRH